MSAIGIGLLLVLGGCGNSSGNGSAAKPTTATTEAVTEAASGASADPSTELFVLLPHAATLSLRPTDDAPTMTLGDRSEAPADAGVAVYRQVSVDGEWAQIRSIADREAWPTSCGVRPVEVLSSIEASFYVKKNALIPALAERVAVDTPLGKLHVLPGLPLNADGKPRRLAPGIEYPGLEVGGNELAFKVALAFPRPPPVTPVTSWYTCGFAAEEELRDEPGVMCSGRGVPLSIEALEGPEGAPRYRARLRSACVEIERSGLFRRKGRPQEPPPPYDPSDPALSHFSSDADMTAMFGSDDYRTDPIRAFEVAPGSAVYDLEGTKIGVVGKERARYYFMAKGGHEGQTCLRVRSDCVLGEDDKACEKREPSPLAALCFEGSAVQQTQATMRTRTTQVVGPAPHEGGKAVNPTGHAGFIGIRGN